MSKYQRGKIYSLRSRSRPDLEYIGSTVQRLSQRLYGHRCDYKRYQAGNYHYTSSYQILELGDAYIELVEYYPCETKAELDRREGEVQRATDCVNNRIAGRTRAEHYADNIDEIKAYKAKYRADNKDKIKERDAKYRAENKDKIKVKKAQYYTNNKDKVLARPAERITCECGAEIRRGEISRHSRTKKHQFWQETYNFIMS